MSSEGAIRDGIGTGFHLIETLGFMPPAGFVRLERHLARLAASADELGFAFDAREARNALSQAVGDTATPQRVRLTLERDGRPAAAAQPFTALAAGSTWTVRIASTTLDSADPLLRHKTSRRAPYEEARAEYPADAVQEVLICNEKGELCEGTITTLFVSDGRDGLLTPPLSSGLLAGALRAELIETGRAREALLSPGDLEGQAFFVGNSLRGLIPARLG